MNGFISLLAYQCVTSCLSYHGRIVVFIMPK